MERLLKIGFMKVGHWTLDNGTPVFSLEREHNSKNVLYAFASNNEVLYVGKTTQPLKKRMYGYQNPGPTQTTNIKNNRCIAEMLSQNLPVEIMALPDNGLLHYGGYHVNLAAGLEDSLVATTCPKWNHLQNTSGRSK